MRRLRVVIHQARPFHQIPLHQAFNAQGVFQVRLSDDVAQTAAWLGRGRAVDVLVLDPDAAADGAAGLLPRLRPGASPRALLLVGEGGALACDARRRGLWVLDELRWPLSALALQQALARL